MEVEIKHLPALRVGAVRHVGPYNQISEAFGRLGQIAGGNGLFRHPEAAMVAIYYDDPESTPPDELRSDAGIVVPERIDLPSGLEERRIPDGEYATTVHAGGYEHLGDTWVRFLGEWLPASGHRLGPGVSYEVYLNNPTQVKKEDLRTEIRVPIAS